MANRYDLVIIGAAPAATWPPIRAAQLGLKTRLRRKMAAPRRDVPERRLHPEQGAARLERALPPGQAQLASHGITTGAIGIDVAKMMARKEQVVRELTGQCEETA